MEKCWLFRAIPELIDSFVYRGPFVPHFVSRVKFSIWHDKGCRVFGVTVIPMFRYSSYQRCCGGTVDSSHHIRRRVYSDKSYTNYGNHKVVYWLQSFSTRSEELGIILGWSCMCVYMSVCARALMKLSRPDVEYRTYWRHTNAVGSYWEVPISYLGRYTGSLDQSFHGFPQFLQTYAGIVLNGTVVASLQIRRTF
jgi:hypothetical protein